MKTVVICGFKELKSSYYIGETSIYIYIYMHIYIYIYMPIPIRATEIKFLNSKPVRDCSSGLITDFMLCGLLGLGLTVYYWAAVTLKRAIMGIYRS